MPYSLWLKRNDERASAPAGITPMIVVASSESRRSRAKGRSGSRVQETCSRITPNRIYPAEIRLNRASSLHDHLMP